MHERKPATVSFQLDGDGGGTKWYEFHFSKCNDDRFLLVIRDLTQQKREELKKKEFEDKVQQSQKLESIGVLASGIAHDFNNLLLSIIGNTELAIEELEENSPIREEIEEIGEAAKKASDLTRQMLAYSGRGKFYSSRLNMNETLVAMVDLLNASISKRIQIEFELAEDLPTFHGDASQIQQVIMNLVSNASEAIGEDSGSIWVRSGVAAAPLCNSPQDFRPDKTDGAEMIYLEVADSGCGMTQQTLEKIFDPFFTTKFFGRGLGMSAVQGILRAHEGVMNIETEIGSGTRIRVFFPKANSEDTTTMNDGSHRREPIPPNKVLVIDDEPSVLRLVSKILKSKGIPHEIVESGEAGVEIVRAQPDTFDLALVDMTMPGITGRTAIEELRKIQPGLRAILSSGFSEEEIVDSSEGGKIDAYIQKPYRPSQLLDCIRETLERKS
ncbi:MAG: response regulator [Candidatus Omnitrophica bacterium]|nr:response regulator [Candidatus Omnitrophota bacterium]